MNTTYKTWGADQIEQGAKTQMDNACALPVAVAEILAEARQQMVIVEEMPDPDGQLKTKLLRLSEFDKPRS